MISSKMVVDITDLPFGVDPGYLETKSAVVTTTLDQLDREREAKAIPWWIIVLAAVAGILLLLLLIFILWKVRFIQNVNYLTTYMRCQKSFEEAKNLFLN